MRAKRAAEGGSGGTPQGNFWDFWPSEVVSDAICECKNVATGVYIDLQLWAQCLLARAWISMATVTVTRRMQTKHFLVQERPASY